MTGNRFYLYITVIWNILRQIKATLELSWNYMLCYHELNEKGQ